MDTKSALWDKDAAVPPKMRQPAAVHLPPKTDEAPKTQLNVNAPEFVPLGAAGGGHSAPTSNIQARLHRFKPNTAPENARGASQEEVVDTNGFDTPDGARLKQIISSLIQYPGRFDDLLVVLLESVYQFFNDVLALSHIARLIVTEGIIHPSFRYNGARICWYIEQSCPEFRAELHMTCKKELQENKNKQDVVLFLAELYTQLPHHSLYGVLLTDSLKQLVAEGGNDNIKCVCQTLKLTGYQLDENNKDCLNELISLLKEVKDVNGSAQILLKSVMNLRDSNWGRGASDSASSDSEGFDFEEVLPPQVYQTNGQRLSKEECEFLAAHATVSCDDYFADIDSGDPDELCDPEPEMDEEIQKAFQEFIKISKR